MQKVAFITGTGKGIGKAIAELLLENNYLVFGFSRTNSIKHPNFSFTKINLSNINEVNTLEFSSHNYKDVLLINNAATLGEVVHIHLKTEKEILNEYNINIITPTLLINKFINTFKQEKKSIINISSGAANKAISGWSTYCATKSALDSLTEVIAEEKHVNLDILSVHPGIVDTNMQKKIRGSKEKYFPLLSKFTDYYTNNELESTDIVAKKLFYIIQNFNEFTKNIVSIRDVNLK